MSELFLFIGLVLSLLSNGLLVYLGYKEKQKILDRAKAKDLEEFKYYEQEYPKDTKQKEKTIKKQIKARQQRVKHPDPKDVMANKYRDKY